MAPKKSKLNVEEQAAKLNLRALALKNKGMKARIDSMLKGRPELHSTVIQHLVGMGCVDPGPGFCEQAGSPGPACLPLSEEALCAHASTSVKLLPWVRKLPIPGRLGSDAHPDPDKRWEEANRPFPSV